jgi:hypothetical protein
MPQALRCYAAFVIFGAGVRLWRPFAAAERAQDADDDIADQAIVGAYEGTFVSPRRHRE